jgi:aldehyde dehydrogenase (NAD+)
VLARHGWSGVLNLVIGTDDVVARPMIQDRRMPLISATGSVRMGKQVAPVVAARLGRTLLELGGNNGVIVMEDANPDLAARAVLFGAVGTAGQRCTSIRRLFLHKGIAAALTERLTAAYRQVRIGAVENMMRGLAKIREQGGEILFGGKHLRGCFVEPTLVRSRPEMPILKEEIFAPILHLIEFEKLEEAIAWHNDVPQGLSSAIFTSNLLSVEAFLSARGSDCGIANVNIGTSGAEIGGAFGGEKDTGGGRESGSDSWKAYMRRQTVTVNWSDQLPLAQGIRFEL